CTDVFRPEWNTWLAFGPSRDAAMEIDALATTRSVEFPVGSPDDANAMFDTITYKKGSAVLRMLEQYLGEETFQRGVAKYLTHHAYDNTETSDLWDALESASGEPVRAIADDWIFQGGLPEVRVEAVDGGVRLGHLCFRYLGAADHTWKVPVRYRDGDGHERVLVDDDVVIQSNAPVIVNARGAGFYRTRYAPPLLAAVAGRFGELDDGERFCLVADTWAAVLAGGVAAGDFLDLITRLRTETEPAVWQAALNGLDELDRIASPDDRPRLQAFVRDLLAARVAALGWHPAADEPERAPQLRGVLLEAMGSLGGDQATQVQARAVLERAFDAPEAVDADVAAAALGVVAATGGRDDFASFIVAWASTESPQVRVRMLRAAAAVPDPGTARELLAMVIDGRIRRQDAYWVVARLLGHRDTGVAVWAEIKARWNEALDAMPPRNARMMLDLIHHRSEPHVAADIAAWLSANPIKGSEQLVAQQLERLQVRVALREREAPRLATALAALESASTPT
ncbi:MAG: ERAP1-like C-terminal domain-containing protein, partial [Acidimicrobiia bacterium]|nr:ERAP1-like C-terminal domain-containing protein [Acidimicrobiia bacterium]